MFTVNTNEHLIRNVLWSQTLKDILEDELMGWKYVQMLTEFADGSTLNIPSIGQAEVYDFVEGQAIQYSSIDTGNFTFAIDQYKQSAHFMSEQFMQDSAYASRVLAEFIPKQARSIMAEMEMRILASGPEAQTVSNVNLINGGRHRFVAGGASGVVELEDFARADYALTKANVPSMNRVAIVDPSVAFTLSTLTNLVNVSNNPMFDGIVTTGIADGPRFVKHVYGFDVYVSQRLKSGITETIDSVALTGGSGVANLFFSATPGILPWVGAVRQAPKVYTDFNKDMQRTEYLTTCRYGVKLFRPENLVVVLSNANAVYA